MYMNARTHTQILCMHLPRRVVADFRHLNRVVADFRQLKTGIHHVHALLSRQVLQRVIGSLVHGLSD